MVLGELISDCCCGWAWEVLFDPSELGLTFSA